MVRFRGRDITSFRPADVHLGAYFKYTVDKTPYGGFAYHTKRVAHNVTPRRQPQKRLFRWRTYVTARLAHIGSEVITCKRLHMVRFRGRDITSFRPADVHLGAYFKYTVDETPYGGFAYHTKRVAHNVTPRRQPQKRLFRWRTYVTARLAHIGSEVITCKRLHMVRFRGRDITSFRPADVHLGAYFKYTVDKTPYGGFA